MKKYVFTLIVALTALALQAQAQKEYIYMDGKLYKAREVKHRLVEWKPEHKGPQRFAIALQPLQLANYGLKVDFEYELPQPGTWLQFQVSGYLADRRNHLGTTRDYYEYYDTGLYSAISGWDNFRRLEGGGIGIGYKSMMGHVGFYWNAAFFFTIFNVHHDCWGYYDDNSGLLPEGTISYSQKAVTTQFYKPAVNFNIGKMFPLSSNVFLDTFIGLGYSYSIYNDRYTRDPYYDYGYSDSLYSTGMYSFGYRGLYVSGGIRIGVMWQKNR